jgi:hypothetical protein
MSCKLIIEINAVVLLKEWKIRRNLLWSFLMLWGGGGD